MSKGRGASLVDSRDLNSADSEYGRRVVSKWRKEDNNDTNLLVCISPRLDLASKMARHNFGIS
jgi:predicted double-glycine peptidase